VLIIIYPKIRDCKDRIFEQITKELRENVSGHELEIFVESNEF